MSPSGSALAFLRSRGALAALLFALAFAVYVAPGRNGGSADTFPAQLLPLSLLGDGNLDFNEFVCPPDPASGRAIAYDPARCQQPLPYYLTVHDGRVASVYPIIPGVLNVPVHLVAAAVGVDTVQQRSLLALLTAALGTAGAVALFFLLLEAMGYVRGTSLLVSGTFAFGTLAWSSAGIGLWQHGPSLLLLTGALLGLVHGGRRGLVWAGLLLGFAVFDRPTNVLLALPLAWHAWRVHRSHRVAFVAAAAVPAILLAAYSQLMLGSVTALGQGQRMRIGAHVLEGLAGVLVSPARGLFVFSPILLVGLLALPRVFARAAGTAAGAGEGTAAAAPAGSSADLAAPAVAGDESGRRAVPPILRPLVIGTALVVLIHGLWHMWWGGHSFGYRMLTETLPGMLLLLAESWEWKVRGSRPLMAVAGVLLAASLWANAMGALVAPCGFDMEPNPVDLHPERLWDVRDTELVRCSARVLRGGGGR